MLVLIYTLSNSDYVDLMECCSRMNLNKPYRLRESDLELDVKNILTAMKSDSRSGGDREFEITDKSFFDPLPFGSFIMFYQIPRKIIEEIIAWYKTRKQWPVFALILPASLEMKLKDLFQHLIDDRLKEIEFKNNKPKMI